MRLRCLLAALLLLLAGCTPAQAPAVKVAADIEPRAIDREFPGTNVALDLPWLIVADRDSLTVHNLETGKSRPVPVQGKRLAGFAAGGGKLVWADLRAERRDPAAQPEVRLNFDIELMDLNSGEVRTLTSDPAAQRHPHTDGRYVVWEDFRADGSSDSYGYPDVYLYDLQTGREQRLTQAPGGQFRPRVGGGKVVWMDGRNNEAAGTKRGCDNCPDNNWNIYYFDIAGGREYPVATHKYMEESPDVSGDRIVWIERLGYANGAVVLLDLKSGQRQRLTDDAVNRTGVRVAGDRIVWTDERRGHATNDIPGAGADILLYNAATGKVLGVTGDGIQMQPAVSGNRVAFVLSTQVNPKVQVITVP